MRILVTGASGKLGSYVLAELNRGQHDAVGWSGRHAGTSRSGPSQRVDLGDPAAVIAALRHADPDVIIHLAAISSAEEVLRDPVSAWTINVQGTKLVCDWAAANSRRLVFASTDLVFDGRRSMYREDDPPNPILEYGRTKQAAEGLVASGSRNLTVRISLLYGPAPPGKESFYDRAIASLRSGVPTEFFADEHRTPLHYSSAALALVKLAEADIAGVIHLGGPDRLSRFDLMRRAAACLGISSELVKANRLAQASSAEPRPADVSLDTIRLRSEFRDLTIPAIEIALGCGHDATS
jgi:dTDP-4-dehydrorhamnose reductase